MALKNRTEAGAAIQAQTAIVGETEYKSNLDDEIIKNALFRKDVSSSESATTAAKTIDFLDIDYIEVAQSANVAYTLSNIQQGEIKYLKINKGTGQEITFANAVNVSPSDEFVTEETEVLYQIFNKDGSNLYAMPISKLVGESSTTASGIVEKATLAESQSGTTDKNITADLFQSTSGLKASSAEAQAGSINNKFINPVSLKAVTGGLLWEYVEIGDWDMDLNASPIANPTNPAGDKDKVMVVQVWIRDTFSAFSNINLESGGTYNVDASEINLVRTVSGIFDSTNYSGTSFNRGFVVIGYIQ